MQSHIEVVSASGDAETESREVFNARADGSWDQQVPIWTNPYIFLRQALVRDAESVPVTAFGREYIRVSFEAPGGELLEGFIDEEDGTLARIRTWIERDGARIPLEITFRFYEDVDQGEGQFPGLIVWKENGRMVKLVSVTASTVE
jgi:hypothetical protein